jgi:cytochrome bd ubiquinol oxidase subunit I
MDNLLAARWQMGLSLAFHIVFAVIGMAMPVMMVIAEAAWLRTGRSVYLDLTRRWAKGTAIFFAVGAVSGTVLSFELGLLWPRFMEFAGPIIGMPFSLEGFAFFLEAIFLGIYLYAWDRIGPRAHLFGGVVVAVSGAFSGVFVVTANAWMNTPAGFIMSEGRVHARLLLLDPKQEFHRAALSVALVVGFVPALLQPLSGDYAAKVVARTQPAKLAAVEGHMETRTWAPVRVGPVEIPGALSFLAFGDVNATVTGLNDIPEENRPPVGPVRWSFQIMVLIGTLLALVGPWAGWLAWRGRLFESRALLRVLVAATPLGFIALEAGWLVTELGRQPWIIQGVMRTSEAVTPMPGIGVSLAVVTVVYFSLAAIVTFLIRSHVVLTRPAARP